MRTRSGRVELACGLACGLLALATWVVYLFVPWLRVTACGDPYGGGCVTYYTFVVDQLHGLDNYIRFNPTWSLLLLAHVACASAVAYGAYRHAARRVASDRYLLWGGAALLLLLTQALDISQRSLPLLWVGVGACLALAVVASVAAFGLEEARHQPAA